MRHGVFAAGVLAAALAFVPSAHARPNIPFVDGDPDGPVYCPYGFTSGSASFTNLDGSPGGISAKPADHRYTITVDAECSFGTSESDANRRLRDLQESLLPQTVSGPVSVPVSDDAGHYTFTLSGTATGQVPLLAKLGAPVDRAASPSGETCSQGAGTDGVMSGTGPEGDFTGAFTFHRIGLHYWIAGTMTGGNEVHKVNLWLDLATTVTFSPAGGHTVSGYANCTTGSVPIQQYPIVGHGVIHDPGDPTTVVTDPINGAVDAVAEVLHNVG